MVFLENAIIALAALAAGLGLGILLSKLFFLAVSALIGASEAVPFAVPPVAVLGTVTAFVGLFLSVNVFSLLGVKRSSISELLKASRGPKPTPRWRPWKLRLGLGLLAGGYELAWVTDGMTLVMNMVPVIGLTIAGTYFIVLIAVVGSSLGAFDSLLQSARRIALGSTAYALNVVVAEAGAAGGGGADAATVAGTESRVLEYLRDRGATNIQSQAIPYFQSGGQDQERGLTCAVVSAVSYNRAAEIVPEFGPVTLGRGEALLVTPYSPKGADYEPVTSVTLLAADGAEPVTFQVVQTIERPWLTGDTVVTSDADFAAMNARATSRHTWLGFEYKGWERMAGVAGGVGGLFPQGALKTAMARYDGYVILRQSGALTMFIGLFVAILFFVMAGSLIYFKLFTEIADDRQQYQVLREIGLTRAEFGRVVSQELGMLFSVPLAFGALHTAFALKALGNLFGGLSAQLDIVGAGVMIGVAYLVAQTLYFLVTRAAYVRQVTAR